MNALVEQRCGGVPSIGAAPMVEANTIPEFTHFDPANRRSLIGARGAFVPSTGLAGAAAIAAATIMLGVVAGAAALIPARRAASVDLAVILRGE